ncbi:MAG: hypothetical protein ACFE91_11825 [Promethearchaeota archaeon]
MHKKRSIKINNPYLRRIRNNLRNLIITACSVEKSNILDKAEESEDEYWAIERPLRASILLCPACFKSDKDMTYNPLRKEWYCTECYESIKKELSEEGRGDEFP